MSAPARGERITVRWPGGPYDFEMRFDRLDELAPPREGWYWLHGKILNRPGNTHPRTRTLYARYVKPDEYELLPRR